MCRAPFANGIHSTAVLSFTSHFFFLHFAPLYSNEQMYLKRSNANSNVRYFDATPVIAGADEPRLIVISKQKKKYLFSARIFRCRCEGFRSGISNEEEELVLFNLDTAFINMVTSVNDVAANNGNGLNIYFKFCQYLK